MAQHIETLNYPQRAMRKIENGIASAFAKSRGLMKTSMRYEYIGDQEGMEVYTTWRTIPNGIVWKDNHAMFEVHWNKDKQEIDNIFLVA